MSMLILLNLLCLLHHLYCVFVFHLLVRVRVFLRFLVLALILFHQLTVLLNLFFVVSIILVSPVLCFRPFPPPPCTSLSSFSINSQYFDFVFIRLLVLRFQLPPRPRPPFPQVSHPLPLLPCSPQSFNSPPTSFPLDEPTIPIKPSPPRPPPRSWRRYTTP